MRIGFLPILYGPPRLFNVSQVNYMLSLIRGLQDSGVPFRGYFFVPESGIEYDLAAAKERFGSNVEVIQYSRVLGTGKYKGYFEEAVIPEVLVREFSQPYGSKMLDVLYTSRPWSLSLLKHILSFSGSSRTIGVDVPIVWMSPDQPVKEKAWKFPITDLTIDLNVLPAVHAISQFLLPLERSYFLREARRLLSATTVSKLISSSFVQSPGIDFSKISKIRDIIHARWACLPANYTPTFHYGGSFFFLKQVDKQIEIVSKLFQRGVPVRFVVSTYEEEPVVQEIDLRLLSFVDVVCKCDQYRYFERMSGGDLFFCFSKDEGCGIGHFEMLASGMIGIFLNRPWLDGMLPKNYPFLVKSVEEGEALAFWINHNFEAAIKMRKDCGIDEFVASRYDYRATATAWLNSVSSRMTVDRNTKIFESPMMQEFLSLVVSTVGDSFSLDDAFDIVKNKSRSNVDLRKSNLCTRSFFRQLLLSSGKFVDTFEESVAFRRSHV